MPTKPSTVPDGYTTVTPWIIVRGAAKFLDYLKDVLDAQEIARMAGPDGSIVHAETRIGDAIVMVFDAGKDWPETHQFLRLYVEDADAVYKRALDHGSRSITEVTELGFGDRVGRFADPWDNVWWVQERVEELDEAEAGGRMGDPKYATAMSYVMDTLNDEMRRRAAEPTS